MKLPISQPLPVLCLPKANEGLLYDKEKEITTSGVQEKYNIKITPFCFQKSKIAQRKWNIKP